MFEGRAVPHPGMKALRAPPRSLYMRSWLSLPLALLALCAALLAAVTAGAASPTVDPSIPAKHDADPVILTGLDFPEWSARSNFTIKLPATDLKECSGSV